MRRIALFMLGVVSIVAVGTACGGGDDKKTIDIPGGGNVEVSEGKLPDGWPDDFPSYDGAKIVGSYRGEQDGIEGAVVTWETDDSLEDVKNYFDDKLEGGDWKTTSTGSFGDSSFWALENSDGSKQGYLNASSADDKVTIVAVVGDAADISGDGGSTPDDGSDSSSTPDDSSSDGGDSGSAELPDEVSIPSGFPEDRVTLPDDVRVVAASTTSASGQSVSYLQFLTKDSTQDVADTLKSNFEGDGWKQLGTTESNGEIFTTYSNEDSTESLTAAITKSTQYDGYTEVVLSVAVAE